MKNRFERNLTRVTAEYTYHLGNKIVVNSGYTKRRTECIGRKHTSIRIPPGKRKVALSLGSNHHIGTDEVEFTPAAYREAAKITHLWILPHAEIADDVKKNAVLQSRTKRIRSPVCFG